MPVVALLEVRVAEPLPAAYDIVHRTLTQTRAFDGCLGVEVLIDEADPGHLQIVERWESMEHDAAYRAWRAGEGKAVEFAAIILDRSLTHFAPHDEI